MLVICGETGSGKTSVAKALDYDYGYDRIISYTTRPRRDDEEEGDDYFFENELEWSLHKGNPVYEFMLETTYETTQGTWKYGALLDDILEADDSTVFVASPREVKFMMDNNFHADDILYVMLVPTKERLDKNLEGRDKAETERRLKADALEFADIYNKCKKVNIEENDTIDDVTIRVDTIYKETFNL